MRKLENVLKVSGFTAALAMTTLTGHAQGANDAPFPDVGNLDVVVWLNEVCSGSITGAGSVLGVDPFPMNGVVARDPISGKNGLRYTLPLPVHSGDVFLYEPGTVFGQDQPSDLIRFETLNVFFFSDRGTNETGPFDLADGVGGIPAPNLNLPVLNFHEDGGLEVGNGLLYIPGPGDINNPPDPGFSDDAAGAQATLGWNITSDVPEPSSLALLGLAGAVALLRKRR